MERSILGFFALALSFVALPINLKAQEIPGHETLGEAPEALAALPLSSSKSKDPLAGQIFKFEKLVVDCDGDVAIWRNVNVIYKMSFDVLRKMSNNPNIEKKCQSEDAARVNRVLADGNVELQTCCAKELVFEDIRRGQKLNTPGDVAIPVARSVKPSLPPNVIPKVKLPLLVDNAEKKTVIKLPAKVPAKLVEATENTSFKEVKGIPLPPNLNDPWVKSMAEKLSADPQNLGVGYKAFAVSVGWYKYYKDKDDIVLPKAHFAKSTKNKIEMVSITKPDQMLMINYDQSSDERRIYSLDLNSGAILNVYKMGHGEGGGKKGVPRNSREEAQNFSNKGDSELPSLGAFVSTDVFNGEHGKSVGLAGLMKGINDNAYTRGMWIHYADYVNPKDAVCGRSHGCIAVTKDARNSLIKFLGDKAQGSSFVFAYKSNAKIY